MDFTKEALNSKSVELLSNMLQVFDKNKVFLYGGIVRDYLIERIRPDKIVNRTIQNKEDKEDLDLIILADDFDDAVSRLSSTTKTLFPALIKERTLRIVGSEGITADITILPTKVDLSNYPFDFTVNTFLCDGRELLTRNRAAIETPFDESWDDLKEGILRAPKAEWLIEESFGALRGIRLYCQTGFDFDERTLRIYPDALKKVKEEISPLLIVREFMKSVSLSLKRFVVALHITHGDDVFFQPVRLYIIRDNTKHLIAVCNAYDKLLSFPSEEVGRFWERWQKDGIKIAERLQKYQMGVTKYRNLLNLTAFLVLFHDIGKAYQEEGHEIISSRIVLKLTDDLSFFPNERFFLYYTVRHHQLVHDAVHNDSNALDWFRRQSDPIKLSLVLFGLADKLSQPPDQISDTILRRYLQLVETLL